jgi:DNA-directed RNA polymerase subunit M/transcription elongation factor TFIIS
MHKVYKGCSNLIYKMQCAKCEGHMIPHYSTIHICLKCGNKEDALNDKKHSY